MGLNCSHGAYDGSYTGFNNLRRAVSKAAGGSYPPHKDKTLDKWKWYVDEKYSKETHPGLYEFLNHSDCDGEISPESCVVVANDLDALLPLIEGQERLLKFIDGCRLAANQNEPLEFM